MKQKIIAALFICSILSCNKKDVVQDDTTSIDYPQEWIFTVDENAERYTHIEINGNNTKRTLADKSYSLFALAEERECKFKISLSRNQANNIDCFKIQSVNNKNRWLLAGLSTNHQEVHLYSGEGGEINPPGDGDAYKFLIHRMEKVDGVKTVVIESVERRGYYISSSQPGFNYSPTQVVLTQESSPEKATHWQCRH